MQETVVVDPRYEDWGGRGQIQMLIRWSGCRFMGFLVLVLQYDLRMDL